MKYLAINLYSDVYMVVLQASPSPTIATEMYLGRP